MRNFIDKHPGVSLLLVFGLLATAESLGDLIVSAIQWIL